MVPQVSMNIEQYKLLKNNKNSRHKRKRFFRVLAIHEIGVIYNVKIHILLSSSFVESSIKIYI